MDPIQKELEDICKLSQRSDSSADNPVCSPSDHIYKKKIDLSQNLKILENETEKIDDLMWVAVTPACGRADFKRKDTSESNAIQTRSRPGVNP